jgi:hypothetical protein
MIEIGGTESESEGEGRKVAGASRRQFDEKAEAGERGQPIRRRRDDRS